MLCRLYSLLDHWQSGLEVKYFTGNTDSRVRILAGHWSFLHNFLSKRLWFAAMPSSEHQSCQRCWAHISYCKTGLMSRSLKAPMHFAIIYYGSVLFLFRGVACMLKHSHPHPCLLNFLVSILRQPTGCGLPRLFFLHGVMSMPLYP